MSTVIFCHGCCRVWNMDYEPDRCTCHPDMAHHMGTTLVMLKTPDQWAIEEDIKILNPDGWRFDETPFDKPISYDQWVWRRNRSTVSLRNLPGQQRFLLG